MKWLALFLGFLSFAAGGADPIPGPGTNTEVQRLKAQLARQRRLENARTQALQTVGESQAALEERSPIAHKMSQLAFREPATLTTALERVQELGRLDRFLTQLKGDFEALGKAKDGDAPASTPLRSGDDESGPPTIDSFDSFMAAMKFRGNELVSKDALTALAQEARDLAILRQEQAAAPASSGAPPGDYHPADPPEAPPTTVQDPVSLNAETAKVLEEARGLTETYLKEAAKTLEPIVAEEQKVSGDRDLALREPPASTPPPGSEPPPGGEGAAPPGAEGGNPEGGGMGKNPQANQGGNGQGNEHQDPQSQDGSQGNPSSGDQPKFEPINSQLAAAEVPMPKGFSDGSRLASLGGSGPRDVPVSPALEAFKPGTEPTKGFQNIAQQPFRPQLNSTLGSLGNREPAAVKPTQGEGAPTTIGGNTSVPGGLAPGGNSTPESAAAAPGSAPGTTTSPTGSSLDGNVPNASVPYGPSAGSGIRSVATPYRGGGGNADEVDDPPPINTGATLPGGPLLASQLLSGDPPGKKENRRLGILARVGRLCEIAGSSARLCPRR